MNTPQVDHEKLNIYQRALEFVAATSDLLDHVPTRAAVHNQLDRASTAIPLNIAEGSGKWTAPDRCRFYDIARGSALECAASLDVAVVKSICEPHQIERIKDRRRRHKADLSLL